MLATPLHNTFSTWQPLEMKINIKTFLLSKTRKDIHINKEYKKYKLYVK